MARHSFIRMSKLSNVQGRVDYISNPKRQEYLYATYSTVEPEFWKHLSEQAQYDFWRSNQPTGKCIEARELIIALPESMTELNPDVVLQVFTEKFRQIYGVQCAAALHHNKTKTNYHIHMIFSERDVLEKTEVKYATRNMFYNEEGRHVRTKKEILDAEGNVRTGCKIIPKGEPYEYKCFSGKKDVFKSRQFLEDVKVMYTELINQCVAKEEDRQQVFDAAGPYLPTKKIGKNNPLEMEIRADNKLRQEWNQTVDQVLIAGGTHEEVTFFKNTEVLKRVADSVEANGNQPGLLAGILRRAIMILKQFLDFLMNVTEEDIAKLMEVEERGSIKDPGNDKGPRPDSTEQELRFMEIDAVHQQLNKCNRKLYALQNEKENLELSLERMSKSIFKIKERKALENRIDGLKRQIKSTREQLELIPRQNGFNNVKEAEAEYKSAKDELEAIRQKQAEWDGVKSVAEEPRPQTLNQKKSVLQALAAKQIEVETRKQQSHEQKRGRNGEKRYEYESL